MWEVRFYYLEGRGGGGGGRFSLVTRSTQMSTHLVHIWRLDHSQAQHEQAEAPPPVGTQSSRTAPASATVERNDASGTGGRETKAPSANRPGKRKLCARNNESDRQRAAPQLSIRRQASSRIALRARTEATTTAKNGRIGRERSGSHSASARSNRSGTCSVRHPSLPL